MNDRWFGPLDYLPSEKRNGKWVGADDILRYHASRDPSRHNFQLEHHLLLHMARRLLGHDLQTLIAYTCDSRKR